MKTFASRARAEPYPDWKILKLGVVAETTDYVANGSFASLKQNVTYRSESNYAVLVRLTDFTKGWSGKYVYVDKSAFEFLRKSRLNAGDVVVANVGDPGRVFRVPDLGQPMTLGPNAVLIRPGPELDRGFLAYFFSSPHGQTLIAGITTGTAQKKFNKTSLRQLSVPVPELSEQREIVAEIEKQFTRLDAGVAGLRRVQANLKRYRAAVLKVACEGKLVPTEAELARQEGRTYESGAQLLEANLIARRDWFDRQQIGAKTKKNYRNPESPNMSLLPTLPDGWTWATWVQLSNWVTYGFTRPMPHVHEGIPIVTAKNVIDGKINFESADLTKEAAFGSLSEKDRPKPNDILITKDGTIGRAALVDSDRQFCINQSVAVIWLRSCPMERKYLLTVIASDLIQKPIWAKARGVAIQHLSITDFAKMPIPIPPLAEQHRIVAEVDRRLSVAEELEAVVIATVQRATRLRQSILQQAFEGS